MNTLIQALENPNVRAFLVMLRHGEGTSGENGYRTMFTGKLFDSYADHPRQAITAKLGKQTLTSTAAGAYQFLSRTWDGLVKQYGFKDFSPLSQDLGAVALVKQRKALEDVIAGRFEVAVKKCNTIWASLPGSPYGQPTVTLDAIRPIYEDAGGRYEAVVEVTPATPPEPPPEKPMTPFIAAVLPSLFDAVPKLAKLFSNGSESATRNEKAVEIAIDVAKAAAGVQNEQALAEALKDPEIATRVNQAVESNWFEISVNVEGVKEAREYNAKASEVPFYLQPAFMVTLMLMPLVYGVTYFVMTDASITNEMKSMVIASIISGVLGAVTGFWLGTSFSSSRKTELMARNPAP